MDSKDYYFNIMWRDGFGKEHKVGVLARIDEMYYLKGRRIDKSLGSLFFRGIPPYYDTKLHASKNLFDFFRMKILVSNNSQDEDLCEILEEKLGKNHIDGYSVTKIENEKRKGQIRSLISSVKQDKIMNCGKNTTTQMVGISK